MIAHLLSRWCAGRPERLARPSQVVSGFSWLVLADHVPQHTAIAEGRDLLALVDGANHLELALQLHCTF
jgi:hypothetical protein